MPRIAALALAALAACIPTEPRTPPTPAAAGRAGPPADIVVTERGPGGGTLVFISEVGQRMGPLTKTGAIAVVDSNAAWSPDGRHVAFASTRGRDKLTQTSLWIIEARAGATPLRLTFDAAVDRDPAWTPDGKALVFASNRGGNFDLWKLPLAPDRRKRLAASGKPTQLTRDPGNELAPSMAPDGERIAYMAVSPEGRSVIAVLEADGAARAVTAGPSDVTPAWSPDGRRIAFASPVVREAEDGKKTRDMDLFVTEIDAEGVAESGADESASPKRLVDEPLADQTGPVWSADGALLFSTSVYRSVATGQAVLSSVTFVELDRSPRVLRALHDPVAVESRTGVTLGRSGLDRVALRENSDYRAALKRAVIDEIIRMQGGR